MVFSLMSRTRWRDNATARLEGTGEGFEAGAFVGVLYAPERDEAPESMRILRLLLATLVLISLFPASSSGQISLSQVPQQRTVPSRDQARERVETSPYHLGPIRFAPVLDISRAGWDSNVYGSPAGREVSAYTATVTAGVRWLVPAGPKMYVVGDAIPAYLWYENLAARSFFGGSFSAYLLGFFNRARLEVGGFNSRRLTHISSETQAGVVQTTLAGVVKMEVDVASNFSVFGNLQVARLRFGQGETQVDIDTSRFQRTEGGAGGGFRYRFSDAFDISAGYEKTRTEFVFVPQQSDNQSDAYLVSIRYDRPRFYVNLAGGYRQGQSLNGSSFSTYSRPTGGYFISYFLTRTIELQAYGDRRVTYGVVVPQFLQTRYGGGIKFMVHPNVLLNAHGIWGTNLYGETGTGTTTRTDTTADYGGGFSATVFRNIVWTATVTQSRFRSPLAASDRNRLRIFTGLSFDGAFKR
jgi:hypothetical protein